MYEHLKMRTHVSIPSEVGRGRARNGTTTKRHSQRISFNPLGGGARSGSKRHRSLTRREPTPCFNPLGGGARSGSPHPTHGRSAPTGRFQSPRRWGEVGLTDTLQSLKSNPPRFNPLGGGARSGSQWVPGASSGNSIGFNPLGGGARSGSAVAATTGPT